MKYQSEWRSAGRPADEKRTATERALKYQSEWRSADRPADEKPAGAAISLTVDLNNREWDVPGM